MAWLLPGGLLAIELGSREQGEIVVNGLAQAGGVGARYEPIGPGPTGLVIVRSPAQVSLAVAI